MLPYNNPPIFEKDKSYVSVCFVIRFYSLHGNEISRLCSIACQQLQHCFEGRIIARSFGNISPPHLWKCPGDLVRECLSKKSLELKFSIRTSHRFRSFRLLAVVKTRVRLTLRLFNHCSICMLEQLKEEKIPPN